LPTWEGSKEEDIYLVLEHMVTSPTTARSLGRRELIATSLSSVRWSVLLAPTATLAGYACSVVLGRLGAAWLGWYSLALTAVTIASSVFLFGGSNVIVKFIPELGPERRSSFLATYALICLAFAAIVAALAVLPVLFTFVTGAPAAYAGLQPEMVRYVLLLYPLVLAQTFAQAILSSHLLLRATNLVAVVIPIFTLAGFVLLYLFRNSAPADLSCPIITVVMIGYLMSIAAALFVTARSVPHLLRGKPRLLLPGGFWRFTLPFHVNTVLYFVVSQFDQLVMIQLLDVRDLGIYRACFVTAALVSWLPDKVMAALYPSLCYMVAGKDQVLVNATYRKALAALSLASSSIAAVLLLFSREVLLLFGEEYVDAGYLPFWILCAGSALFFPLSAANGTLIVAMGRNDYNLLPNGIGAVTGVLLSLVLVRLFGTPGAALARTLALGAVVTMSSIVVVRKLRLEIPWAPISICLLPAIVLCCTGPYLLALPLAARMALALSILIVPLCRLKYQY
jgi:O-antigen/teichoic acid export membrane protein